MSTGKRSILVILAVFVFLLASGGRYANNMLESRAKIEAKSASENNEAIPKQASLSIDIFNSVIQVSHLVFHSNFIFEFNLPEITETKAHSVIDTALNFTKYYKTLLRLIISPNAP